MLKNLFLFLALVILGLQSSAQCSYTFSVQQFSQSSCDVDTLIATVNGTGNYSFQWYRDSTFITSETTGKFFVTQSGKYFVEVSDENSCVSGSKAFDITNYSSGVSLNAGNIGSDQSICYNTQLASLTEMSSAFGGSGNYQYQWQISSDNSSWINIAGATNLSYSPANLSTTVFYRRQVSDQCNMQFTPSVKITVLPDLISGNIGSNQTICYGNTPMQITNITAASGGAGTYAYGWQSSPNNAVWTTIAGANGINFQPSSLNVDTYYRRTVQSATCGTVYSPSVKISVNAPFSPGSIGYNQTICYNTAPSAFTQLTASTGGATPYTYSWEKSINGGITWSAIASVTGTTYTSPALTQTTMFRRVVTSSNGCGSATSAAITVTVNPLLTAGSIGSDQTICANTWPAPINEVSSASGATGTYTYQWQTSTDMVTWAYIPSATGSSYSPGSVNTDRWFRRIVTSGTCGSVTSNAVHISTLPGLNAGSIGSDQTICYNSTPAAFTSTTPASGGTGTYAYQWEKSTDGGSSWIWIAGATLASYAESAPLTQLTWYRRSVVSGTGTCSQAQTVSVRVDVEQPFNPGSIGSNQTICYNTTPAAFTSITPASGGTGTYAYQWEKSMDNGPTWIPIAGATSASYAETAPLTQRTLYRRSVVSGTGTCNQAQTVTVRVDVEPPFNPGKISGDQLLCNFNDKLETITDALYSSPPNNSGYHWEVSFDSTNWLLIAGATSRNLTPIPQKGKVYYRREASTNCGSGYSNVITVTDNKPDFTVPYKDTIVCAGKNLSVMVPSNPNYTYEWSGYSTISNTNSNQTDILIDKTGYAVLKVTTSNICTAKDTIRIQLADMKPFTLNASTSCIFNSPVTVSASDNGKFYWYKNDLPYKAYSSSISVNEPGEYYAVKDYGCGNLISDKKQLFNCMLGTVTGKVYDDINNNYVRDAGEMGIANVKILVSNKLIGFTDKDGNYSFYLPVESAYTLSFKPDSSFIQDGQNVVLYLPSSAPVSEVNYGLKRQSVDLSVYGYFITTRPGFSTSFYLTYSNLSYTSLSGKVDFYIPADLTFKNSTQEVTVSGNVISLDLSGLTPYTLRTVRFDFAVPSTLPLGTILNGYISAQTNQNDFNTSNNNFSTQIMVRGSQDPNDKSVSPVGFDLPGYVAIDQDLTYTIRFQNTGTDTAFTVVVVDTIDEDLDFNSIKIIGASHDYEVKIDSNRVVKFVFSGINLPDSTTNEQESHGAISFRMKQNASNTYGTVITNKAGIYFDFNAPVITNEVLNTIGNPILTASKNKMEKDIFIFPNPANDVINFGISTEVNYSILDLAGREIKSGEGSAADISNLEKGSYLIKMKTGEIEVVRKFVKQ